MWFSPVSDSASISSILRSVGIGPFSNWKPSRGPSSLICTSWGKSDIRRSSLFVVNAIQDLRGPKAKGEGHRTCPGFVER